MSTIVHSTAPDAAVIFYPFDVESTKALGGASQSEFMATTPTIVTDDIISIATQKGKGGVGSFSIVIASNQAYKGRLNPGSWCMIYISDQKINTKDGASISSGFKMLGIVRSIKRQEMNEGGRRMVRYVVSGEDFQSIFNTPIYLNAQLGGDSNSPVAITIAKTVANNKNRGVSQTAAVVMEELIDVLLGPLAQTVKDNQRIAPNLNLATVGGRGKPVLVPAEVTTQIFGVAPPGNAFTSMITFFLQKDLVGECLPIPDIGGVTPVWSILSAFRNEILNEIYTDLLPVNINGSTILAPSFVLRAIPFSSTHSVDHSCIKFLDAPKAQTVASRTITEKRDVNVPIKRLEATNFYVSRQIMEHEILSLSSGKSDAERFNFFMVIPSAITGHAQTEGAIVGKAINSGGLQTLADVPSLQRYGLKPYIAYSRYFLENGNTAKLDLINRIAKDLWDRAHVYENGQVQLIGSLEHIPVGTNIEFAQRGWVAHVELVEHQYSVSPDGPKSFRTNISFVRLQQLDGSPIELTEDVANIQDGQDETGKQGDWDRGVSRGGIRK